MSVITISREFGSDGSYIASKIAESLGYHLADKKMIGTVLDQYGLVEFDKEYDTIPSFWDKFISHREERREVMVDMLNRVMLALAHHGDVVILGRGSFVVLGGFSDVFNVLIQSPLPVRIKRVMEQHGIATPEEAETEIKENDRVRANFMESFYTTQNDTKGFDLVINTGKISPDLAVSWLLEAVKGLKEKVDSQPTTESIEVDPILASAISSELKCQVAHR